MNMNTERHETAAGETPRHRSILRRAVGPIAVGLCAFPFVVAEGAFLGLDAPFLVRAGLGAVPAVAAVAAIYDAVVGLPD